MWNSIKTLYINIVLKLMYFPRKHCTFIRDWTNSVNPTNDIIKKCVGPIKYIIFITNSPLFYYGSPKWSWSITLFPRLSCDKITCACFLEITRQLIVRKWPHKIHVSGPLHTHCSVGWVLGVSKQTI